LENFNDSLFYQSWKIVDDSGNVKQAILLNTERHSVVKNKLINKFRFVDCNYFFHAFAAADWYRGYRYCTDIIPLDERKFTKKFISFNRLTGGARSYRSLFVAELIKHNLLEHGHISYSLECPQYGKFDQNLRNVAHEYQLSNSYVDECVFALQSLKEPLNIDYTGVISNNSQTLNALPFMIESFLHVVTETCFWEDKTHLTEKIFKPIVAKQPFVLLGCANNLSYLQSYGFKTFDSFWDESYDTITDPLLRLNAVIKIVNKICSMSDDKLQTMYNSMKHILEYNYNWFYSQEFINYCWKELTDNLTKAIAQLPPRTYLGNQYRSHSYIGAHNTHL
jgi:hypothetical protein